MFYLIAYDPDHGVKLQKNLVYFFLLQFIIYLNEFTKKL